MIKKLAKSIREYKRPALLTSFFVIIEVIFEVAVPFLMAYLVDEGIEKSNIGFVCIIGAILIVCAGMGLLFGILSGRFASTASNGFAKNLRQDIYGKVQEYSFKNIDKFSTSSIITRITTDTSNVQMAFQMLTRIVVRCPLMLLFSLIATIITSPTMAVVYLVAIPVVALLLYLVNGSVFKIFGRGMKLYDKLNKVVEENVRGIRVVKSYVREDAEIKKFQSTSNDIYKCFNKAEGIVAFNQPIMQFAVYGVIIALVLFGGNTILSGGNLTTGDLFSLISYATMILSSLMMMSFVLIMLIISKPSAIRIKELLDEQSDISNPETPIFEVKNGDIDFENVCFSYSKTAEKNCLENVNLSINSGEIVGILGGTGSAKSTLISLIPRLYDVNSGVVKLGGIDVKKYDLKTLRDNVSVVLQKNVLFSGTIAENLRWGNETASIEELQQALDISQASSFVNSFPEGLDTHIEQGGTNLSGGQKQRLCIARALLKKPKVLIMDDSTSAVDTKTDALIRQSFKTTLPNTTKIIIAQRVASVQEADKIIVLDDGKIMDIGTHEELLKKCNIYKEVFISQTQGGRK